MNIKIKIRFLVLALILSFSFSNAQFPDTDIWLLDVTEDSGKISLSNPINITSREGYDNQPMFSSDGTYVLFSSIKEDKQADIYKYVIQSKLTTQFTKTEESEYSPTFTPDGKFISCVRVEKDSSQRLWKFPVNGGEPILVMKDIKNIGYHCWLNKDSVVLFILPQPFTLQLVNVGQQSNAVINDSIGRCTQLLPDNQKIFSYTTKDTAKQVYINFISYDKALVHNVSEAIKLPLTSEDYVWYNKNTIITTNGSKVLSVCYQCADKQWQVIQDLEKFGISNLGRIMLSKDRKKVALVTTK